jgi:hypothetical protein
MTHSPALPQVTVLEYFLPVNIIRTINWLLLYPSPRKNFTEQEL